MKTSLQAVCWLLAASGVFSCMARAQPRAPADAASFPNRPIRVVDDLARGLVAGEIPLGVLTALIGTLFFTEKITLLGWLAILVAMGGVILMLLGKLGATVFATRGEALSHLLLGRPAQVALACALLFSFSYLFLRAATLELGEQNHFLWRSAWTVVLATVMQVVCLGLWLARTEPAVFRQMGPMRGIASFIGLTSALGSIGWYTAFALQNAAYVRAVGQIEAVFMLTISWLYFRERITALELTGIACTIAGVLMFRLV